MIRRLVPVVLCVSALAAGCGGSDAETTDDPGEIAFDLAGEGEAGVAGVRATLRYETRDRTTVVIDGLDEGEPAGGGPNPAWLRMGSCSEPGDEVARLEDVSGSSSETSVGLGLPALLNGDYAVQVGLTQSQPEVIACGDVPDDAPEEEESS